MTELHPHLQLAIEEETAYSKQLTAENLKQSPNQLRKDGLSLFPCSVSEIRTGTNGEFYTLETSFVINNTYFRRGAKVLIHVNDIIYKGRIVELNTYNLVVFTNDEIDENLREHTIRIDFTPDDRTLECMQLGLRFLKEKKQLQDFAHNFTLAKKIVPLVHSDLNDSQQLACGAIIGSDSTTVIQGPPGTGKTHTLALAIRELVKQGKKVLITAPSNTAVDNLCRKVLDSTIQLLRIGNEEKIASDLLPYTLDYYLDSGNRAQITQHIKRQIQKLEQVTNRHIRNYTKEAADEKRNARKELRELKKDLRNYALESEQQLISSCQVLAGTPVGLFNALPKEYACDVVIIDEAGQALAPLCWLVASFGKKLVLCGDPQQLPPVVLSQKAQELGLGKSLLETVCELQTPLLLNTQYRMPPEVVGVINPFFYDNQLMTFDENVKGEVQFIDMAGFGEGEQEDEKTGSFCNPDEAQIVQQLIENEKLQLQNTVVLAPYSAQIALLQKTLGSDWRVSTIDSIQGQEEQVVIISLTRSNAEGIIGFLKDYRRMNVAISRTKKRCYLIGDSATLGSDSFYDHILRTIETQGTYRSAWEFSV